MTVGVAVAVGVGVAVGVIVGVGVGDNVPVGVTVGVGVLVGVGVGVLVAVGVAVGVRVGRGDSGQYSPPSMVRLFCLAIKIVCVTPSELASESVSSLPVFGLVKMQSLLNELGIKNLTK